MNKYILITMMLLLTVLSYADQGVRIGNRHFDDEELREGFEAYLTYLNPGHISSRDSLSLFAHYFDELIGMYIYDTAIAEGMVQVSEEELEQEILTNPPQGMLSIADFQSNGAFDKEKYQQALKQNPAFKASVMNFSREVFAYKKLLNSLRSKATIDTQEVRIKWMQQGSKVDAKIICFDYNKLDHITADSTDARLLYEQNKDNYKRTKGRNLLYVSLTGESSRANSGRMEEIEQQSRILQNAALAKGLLAAASEKAYEVHETPFFSAGDDIIRGIGKDNELVAMVFAAKPGDVLPIYKNPFGDYYVIQVKSEAEEYYIPFEMEYDVLMHQARQQKRKDALKEIVHQFIRQNEYDQYLNAAQRDGYTIVDAKDISLDGSIEGIGKVEILNRTIMGSPEQSYSPLIEHNGFFYLAWVENRSIRNERAWQIQKEELLSDALKEAQEKYLDDWYIERYNNLDIQYPKVLQGK